MPVEAVAAPMLSYDESVWPVDGDPLLVAAALVDAIGSEEHVLYENDGAYALAVGALARLTVDRTTATLTTAANERALPWKRSPLESVDELLSEAGVAGWRAYGWAGFELAYAHAGRSDLLRDGELLHLVIPHTEVLLQPGSAVVRSTRPDMVATIEKLLAEPAPERSGLPTPVDVMQGDLEAYTGAVATAVQEIKDRLLQKVILSRVLPVDRPVDLVSTYVLGRRSNTPARSFLLNLGGLEAAGFSPEIVTQVDERGRVTTQPLAGTRELAGAAEQDLALREDLLGDSKEIFEHAISVKVAYDELAELCEPGSVVVEEFMTVKERGSVQHLASSVSGQLTRRHGAWEAFGALFPAVTASGVPKVAAYESIRRNEPGPRGLYSGAVLTVDESGALDAALVLRTIFRQHGRTWLRAGAGIVEQSRPERELTETCEKLRSVALHLVTDER